MHRGGESAAVTSLVLGYGVWAAEIVYTMVSGETVDLPIPLMATAVSFVAYVALALRKPPH